MFIPTRNVFENLKNNKVGFWSETPKNEKINKCGKKGIKTDKGTAFFWMYAFTLNEINLTWPYVIPVIGKY